MGCSQMGLGGEVNANLTFIPKVFTLLNIGTLLTARSVNLYQRLGLRPHVCICHVPLARYMGHYRKI